MRFFAAVIGLWLLAGLVLVIEKATSPIGRLQLVNAAESLGLMLLVGLLLYRVHLIDRHFRGKTITIRGVPFFWGPRQRSPSSPDGFPSRRPATLPR